METASGPGHSLVNKQFRILDATPCTWRWHCSQMDNAELQLLEL